MARYQVIFLKRHRYDEDIPEQRIQRQVEARDPEDAFATVQAQEYDADRNASFWSYLLIGVQELGQDQEESNRNNRETKESEEHHGNTIIQ